MDTSERPWSSRAVHLASRRRLARCLARCCLACWLAEGLLGMARCRLDGRFLSLEEAPFGDRPARDHEFTREYDGEECGLPGYSLQMSTPFLRLTAEDDPLWKGRWVSNVRHDASGAYLAAFPRRICSCRRKPKSGRKAPRLECECPLYFFVTMNTASRSNVPISHSRLVCWAAGQKAKSFSDATWLEHGALLVHHDDAAIQVVDGVSVKSDADPALLTAQTQQEHRELHQNEGGANRAKRARR